MMKKLLLLVLLLCLVVPISAQDTETTPLMEMLALVPNDAPRELYFADIVTAIETRHGTDQILSIEDWQSTDETLRRQWIAGLPSTIAPNWRDALFTIFRDDEPFAAFDIFQAQQMVYFGEPPATGFIMQGDFDNEAIAGTFVEMGTHERFDEEEYILLCSVEGCDTGMDINPQERNMGNPFGGNFGRREPIALVDNTLLNSPDNDVLNAMLATYQGDESLMDNPDYAAVAHALAERGELRQAFFLDTTTMQGWGSGDYLLGSRLDEAGVAQAEAWLEERIPAYDLLALAETVQDDQQFAHAIVVYDNEADAQAAAPRIAEALQADGVPSLMMPVSVHEFLMARGISSIDVDVVVQDDRALVFVTLTAPLVTAATETPENSPSRFADSGLQYKALFQMIVRRDMLWLASE